MKTVQTDVVTFFKGVQHIKYLISLFGADPMQNPINASNCITKSFDSKGEYSYSTETDEIMNTKNRYMGGRILFQPLWVEESYFENAKLCFGSKYH